jgi:hypothetical protein
LVLKFYTVNIIFASKKSFSISLTVYSVFVFLQNALAATTAPYPGQYSGFEAYPYATAATGIYSLYNS